MPDYDVTVEATFNTTQTQLEKEILEAAIAAIENGRYNIAQATGNDVASVKAWLIDILKSLFGNSPDTQFRSGETSLIDDIMINTLSPAIAGTEKVPAGKDGSFEFFVTLTCGATTIITNNIPGVINATPYTITGINELAQTSVLKVFVLNGRLQVSGLTAGKQWSVYNISGVLVYRNIATEEVAYINLPSKGVYIVQSRNENVKTVYYPPNPLKGVEEVVKTSLRTE